MLDNSNTTKNRLVNIRVPNNLKYLGAKFTLLSSEKRSYTKEMVKGVGFMSDQTPDISFGIKPSEKPLALEVELIDGKKSIYKDLSTEDPLILK